MFFLVVKPLKFYSVYKILHPKRRVESYSILGTIVSPNKIPLNLGLPKALYPKPIRSRFGAPMTRTTYPFLSRFGVWDLGLFEGLGRLKFYHCSNGRYSNSTNSNNKNSNNSNS